jgi:hypothetical protein
MFVAALVDQDVEHFAFVIDGTPQVHPPAAKLFRRDPQRALKFRAIGDVAGFLETKRPTFRFAR